MRSRHLIFLLVLLTFFAACNGEARPTPTPFSDDGVGEETRPAGAAVEVSISDLVADPEAYANSLIEISGKFRRLPLLVCENDPHPAPATWQLMAEDGSLVALGGYDSQVRSLLPNDLMMTASGIWQLFDGPVGCGKSASSTQIWYLKVSDVISPSPIARVTLTPTGSGSQIADSGGEDTAVSTPDENGNLPPTATSTDSTPPDSTPPSASTTIPSPPGAGGGTATQTPNPAATSPGGSGSGTPTNTPSPIFTTNPNETSTVTPTSSGSATPTAANGTATPTSSGGSNPTPTTVVLSTATRNANELDIVEFDDINSESPILEFLGLNEAHQWPILFDYSGTITITAIGESTMNLVVEIINSANDVVQQANSGGTGALESISGAQLNMSQDYKIRVYEQNAVAGHYCLIFNEAGGYPDTIKGRIAYGQTINDTLDILGISYWCFLGNFEDDISASANPTGAAGDVALALYGPPDFTSIGDVYESSEITNTLLPDDGMFIIGVLDFEAVEKIPYTLTLTQN